MGWGLNYLDLVLDLFLIFYGLLYFIILGYSCVFLYEYCFKIRRFLTFLIIFDDLYVIYFKKIMVWEKEMSSVVREFLYLRVIF